MAEGHIEFTLSVCLCVPDSCLTIISSCILGFENYLAEMIITTRQCVGCMHTCDNLSMTMLEIRFSFPGDCVLLPGDCSRDDQIR